jgi:uroporphyrinogen-III decarboxylase
MTTKERFLAAIRCQEVDYVPLSMHFWHEPRHARASWRDERERLAMYREWEWDTSAGLSTHVSPAKDVCVEVRYEDDGGVLHQTWRTPAGTLEERLRITDDWDDARDITTYLPIYDDFRSPRYIEAPIKDANDIPALEYLFALDNPADIDAMVRGHRHARALADEFQVPLSVNHPAGMDWLTWLCGAAEAVMQAVDDRPLTERILAVINAAYQHRLEVLLELGVDMVERRGWYETAAYWSPSIVEELGRPALEAEIAATHRAGAAHVYLMDTGIAPLLPMLASLPFDCLNGVEPVYAGHDQKDIRRGLPGKSFWCGISGPEHLGRGTPESVERAVEQAFADFGKTGFILGTAVGIRHNWPAENIAACERAWRRLR